MLLLRDGEHPVVRVLPITHTPPHDPAGALEIPPLTKLRLGLDSVQSWVVLDEANDFIWPGPDLRLALSGDPSTAAYGMLPAGFMAVLKERLLARYWAKQAKAVRRSE